MNVRDSEVIAGLLKAEGWELVDNPDEADVVILNTCSVRQHAEEKVWSEIGRVVKLPQKKIVGLVGCMAQNYKEQVFQRAPQVDFVVGPSDIAKIPEIVGTLFSRIKSKKDCFVAPRSGAPRNDASQEANLFERKIWETDGTIRPEEIYHTGFYEDKEHAFVVISEGCSNYCSYCIVPYVRGRLRNRRYQDILQEIEEAVKKGITRITLLGQNVNAYKAEISFIELLKSVNDITGIREFSFVTSHPRDTSVELFQAMAECKKLKKYLHLPVQSGSDKVLKLMNRGYSRDFYLDLARKYRKMVKGGALTTDIIVGFPSETEKDFQDTYDLVKEAEFNAAFIFKYSPRPHTTAAGMPDDVAKEEKERRHRLVLELQKKISMDKKC